MKGAEMARGVGELPEPLADDKGIHLKVEAPTAAPLHGNRELISQALANLVDNAIKYGGINGADAEIIVTARGGGGRIFLAAPGSGGGRPSACPRRPGGALFRPAPSRPPPAP